MILNDSQISARCTYPALFNRSKPMIDPFVGAKYRMGSLSYGLSHYGYDIRIAGSAFFFKQQQYVDPAGDSTTIERIVYNIQPLDKTVLRPGQLIFASTLEVFNIHHDLLPLIVDKSTLARLGVAVQNTSAEPGWCGHLTVEISNHGSLDVQLRDGMPIAQMIFLQGEVPDVIYNGRYQNQKMLTGAMP